MCTMLPVFRLLEQGGSGNGSLSKRCSPDERIIERGYEDEGDALIQNGQAPLELEPVHFGHLDVRQDAVERVTFHCLQ